MADLPGIRLNSASFAQPMQGVNAEGGAKSQTIFIPAARNARVMHRRVPRNQEGTGNAGCRNAPASLACKREDSTHASRDRYANIPAFPARWCYGLYALSPGCRA